MSAHNSGRREAGGRDTEVLERPGGGIGGRILDGRARDPLWAGLDERQRPQNTPSRDRTLLIVDDDAPFRTRLTRAMESRGFECEAASSVAEGVNAARRRPPCYALLDLRLEDGSGLDVAKAIHAHRRDAKVVMLTGYGNIATAVAAVKAGAVDYLAKPIDVAAIEAALLADGDRPPPPEHPMSADRVRWEHIQRVYELCDRNVSETARRLNMHRRTLQRILAKRAPLEKTT